MSKSHVVAAGVAVALTAAAFALNPSAQRHREAIGVAVAERTPLGGLGLGSLVAWAPEYQSYGVVSVTRFQGRLVSVGAFHGVYVLSQRS